MKAVQSRILTLIVLGFITLTVLVTKLKGGGREGEGGRGGGNGGGGDESGESQSIFEYTSDLRKFVYDQVDSIKFVFHDEYWRKIMMGARMVLPNNPVIYRHIPPPESIVVIGRENQTFEMKRLESNTTNFLRSYYHALKALSGHCRKLYRAGGKLPCRGNSTTIMMDGDKLVCLDEAFEIFGGKSSRETENCLVLSFGVFVDTSFDESIRRANCEVFMFDIMTYTNYSITNDKYVHFHQIGLGVKESKVFAEDSKEVFHVSNLNNIVLKFGLQRRIINILKMDIEGEEWDILADMVREPYLDVIGQIAVELHSFPDNIRDPLTDDQELKTFHDILLAFEMRGFRRVAYWDNIRSHRLITDYTDGVKYPAEGETLLINTNWYNTDFKKRLRAQGLNFE